MKQIYINETPVESVAVDYTDLPRLSRRPYTYAKLRAYLKRREGATIPRSRVLSQIGGVDVEPVSFTSQIRDDGVHLFVPDMLDELGAFAGLSGCCFELWKMIRAEAERPAASFSSSRIQYITPDGIRCSISEGELLRKIRTVEPGVLGSILCVIDGQIERQALEEQRAQRAGRPRVIQFPTTSGQY